MERIEPTDVISTLFGWLGLIPDPVIEGLTIVAAGYILFRLERRARRKEMAQLIAAILRKCNAVIYVSFADRQVDDVQSISILLQLRPAHDEFIRISDKIAILDNELSDLINRFFFRIHGELIRLEWMFRSIGPTGMHIDEDFNYSKHNLESMIYLIQRWQHFEVTVAIFEEIAPLISKITGLNHDALMIDVAEWAPRKAELEARLTKQTRTEPFIDDPGEAD